MGIIYAENSLTAMVGAYEGLTLDEILLLNKKTFKAKIERHWDNILNPNIERNKLIDYQIKEVEGRYFLDKKYKECVKDLIPQWKEAIKDLLNEKKDVYQVDDELTDMTLNI